MGDGEWVQEAFRVSGRVQGIGYRWWARKAASELGVGGTVENLPDGSVMVQAIAPADKLEAFAMQLAKGPWGARIDRVERLPSEGRLSRERFEILL